MSKKSIAYILLFALSVALGVALRLSQPLAEFYTLHIAPVFRIPLSFIASRFPFSVGESVVLILLVIALFLILSGLRLTVIKLFKLQKGSYFKVYLKILLYSLSAIYFIYAFGFQASYCRKPLNEAMGLEKVEMTKENVSNALGEITHRLWKLEPELTIARDGSTVCPFTFNEAVSEVLEGAKEASKKYPFYQKGIYKAKPIAFSTPLAYTGISGIYSFFTGESNINTAFSDYSIPFTAAHEYSHQMGIGSEKDAEFSALLICLESEHPYVRYSAYSQAAVTLSNLLFELDSEEFYNRFSQFPTCLVTDIYLSARDIQKYSETFADEIAAAVNDTYLTLSGDEGIVSYSNSAQLYTAYFLRSEE